jgi:GMP synthase (glutamine-hydrolysing)
MFNPREFVEKTIENIKNMVGKERVVSACSGGVDSTTSAFLAHKALGDSSVTVFIDDGLRREGEPEFVIELLKSFGLNYRYIDAKEDFFFGLKNKIDAEQKRKTFREIFYRKLGEVVKEEGAKFLIQGTIAADVVETVGGIKTQHNVLEQIGIDTREYGFELIEPLKDLYKPEVREVARELGLPKEVSERMPFPGPALSIRVLGEVTPERVEIVRRATKIVEEETKNIKTFQGFAVLHNDRATGIKNGKRVYGNIITIRLIESEDAIEAKVVEVPHELLKKISKRITDEIPSVVKCLFDITDKPPSTIEFE